jgi:hypothetical protein
MSRMRRVTVAPRTGVDADVDSFGDSEAIKDSVRWPSVQECNVGEYSSDRERGLMTVPMGPTDGISDCSTLLTGC